MKSTPEITATVEQLPESQLPADVQPLKVRTVTFEDHGQDFLEWDLDQEGRVIESRGQNWAWKGWRVRKLKVGVRPVICERRPGDKPMVLKYPIIKIEPPILEAEALRYEGDEYIFTLEGDVVTVTDKHRPELEPIGHFIWNGKQCLDNDLEPVWLPTDEQDDAEAYFGLERTTVAVEDVPQLLQDLAEKIGEQHPNLREAAQEAAQSTVEKLCPPPLFDATTLTRTWCPAGHVWITGATGARLRNDETGEKLVVLAKLEGEDGLGASLDIRIRLYASTTEEALSELRRKARSLLDT